MNDKIKKWGAAALVIVAAAGAYVAWSKLDPAALPAGIVAGNGRIEAVEIDISTRTAGRIKEILVNEGDFVEVGQVLAVMDTEQLESRRRQAEADLRRATISISTAQSLVAQREAESEAAVAVVAQREAQLDAADRKLARSEQLVKTQATSQQVLDDDRANQQGAKAAVGAARAQLAATQAAISAAKAQVVDAEAAVEAARAAIASIASDINDSSLRASRSGRIQYRVAQPGEVLSAGGRVLNLVDVGDVYMTFFLPTTQAGRIALGSDVRIVLDAAPQYVIPASVSFVADVAQFTPKTVETREEREKLMFRIRAKISEELLRKYVQQVKTGLPGMAYVKITKEADWPANLARPVQ
ncbi:MULTISPECIES: HlyD family efflux transporter periplasmic adaptor subunit [Hyphomicrobiales]|uniref:HlyD family secretion protein n=1 Tax=Hyphomicrobiales TaxID=356 RepID=UPI000C44EB37|nr:MULTISPECIES: HlyD family efflux transporter periplasmic adaptor subunit [Hyphomicrobiales]MAA99214.1 glycoside hydrolase family 43 [Stappia sp.]MAM93380.1 glycoside hydrolase family 43 [Parvibaculum sp.]MBM19483.1 glycoside hydrolase family 43 [Stappia sp.]NIJ42848.1 HlyD family secretion protein [Parvibaculum indicum]|tara:strand:- start:1594 stop:2661 length:1068 start_codon:yes stop_codon:yes gene_type:complete